MTTTHINRKVYQAHRDVQRKRILSVAEMLFIQNGIDNVSMGEIATLAKITRVTLYEYFSNKEEIAWEIYTKILEDIAREIELLRADSSGNGYEKLERYVKYTIKTFQTHPERYRFVAVLNFLYARRIDSDSMVNANEKALPGIYHLHGEMIKEGIADGSIRNDLDIELASAAIKNFLNGVAHRLALLQDNVFDEFGFDSADLYEEICLTYLRGLRA
ncbi:MAG: TetR/AcrR family transcriptional regulator [Anaerolineae bacterium]|nr:TetR/AcrR family transcriptional regulator [Anaerolineae bacterium]